MVHMLGRWIAESDVLHGERAVQTGRFRGETVLILDDDLGRAVPRPRWLRHLLQGGPGTILVAPARVALHLEGVVGTRLRRGRALEGRRGLLYRCRGQRRWHAGTRCKGL